MVLHLDGVCIHLLVFQFVGLSLSGSGTYNEPLGVLSMLHFDAGGVVEGDFFREASGSSAISLVAIFVVGFTTILVVSFGCSLFCVLIICFPLFFVVFGSSSGIPCSIALTSAGSALLCVARESLVCIGKELPFLVEHVKIQATIDVDGALCAGGVT